MPQFPLRRTFNIGNYESISIEQVGDHADINRARLLAARAVLLAVQPEMYRIFMLRDGTTNNPVWAQVQQELQWVEAELSQQPQ